MQTRENNSTNFLKECKAIFSNKDFLIFAFISGVNSASICAVEILANQIILYYYPVSTYTNLLFGRKAFALLLVAGI